MSTYGPTNLPAYFNTDADFRTWGSGINAALVAAGLVQTADTGQINWTTVAKPAGASTVQGYEIWRFNDSLQGTAPIFLKVQYASAGAADRPNLSIGVGTGSNGTGTLTGQLQAGGFQNGSASKTAGATLPTYAAGGDGYFAIASQIDSGTTTFGFMFAIERLRDVNGAATADGFVYFNAGYSSASYGMFQVIPASGTIPTAVSGGGVAAGPPILDPNLGANSNFGGNVAIMFPVVALGKTYYLKSFAAYNHTDITALASFSVSMFGAARTMMPLGKTCGVSATSAGAVKYTQTGGASNALAMIFE